MLAAAKLQRASSPLIIDTTALGIEENFLKTLALHFFQISHEVNMMREARDFLQEPLTKTKPSHQSLTESRFSQSVVSTQSMPKPRKD
jgi:hypothetical protein